MNSRMDKYYNSSKQIGKRSQKNEQLYKEVNKQSLEDFNVNSNVSVLGDNGKTIDLEMLKSMLDKRYKQPEIKKKIELDLPDDDDEISLEQTREYDINAILEKAHENKVVDYEKERLKKIRDTQYDILKGLNLDEKEEEEYKEPTEEEKKLMTLINTITAHEEFNKNKDLDLFQDLKGSDDTEVLDGLKEDITKLQPKIEKKDNKIDKSFYTSSLNLSKNDFDDFKDLQKDVKSNKILVVILTIVIILACLFGIFIFLNIYFKWGIL